MKQTINQNQNTLTINKNNKFLNRFLIKNKLKNQQHHLHNPIKIKLVLAIGLKHNNKI